MEDNGFAPMIKGEWLAEAIEAQDETLYSAAKLIAIDHRKLYAHRAEKKSISTQTLAALCIAMPTLPERYVLTGKGPKKLTPEGIDEELLLDIGRAKRSLERILSKLIPDSMS